MKICPQCQTSYTDDSLQFCLQDGTPLVSSPQATGNWGESETLVSPRHDKMRVDLPPPQNSVAGSRETFTAEAPKKSNTALIVALTALLTLIAVGAGAIGVVLFNRQKNREVAQNINVKPNNSFLNLNQNSENVSNVNSNANSNVNANANRTPTATPTPKPTLNPKEADEIKSDVKDVIDEWNDALENHDLDSHLSNYAGTVNYYKSGATGIGKIRADKQRAFDSYEDINLKISDMKVTPDETGEKATAVFDKQWKFEGEEKYSSGKVQQQLELAKIGGRWLITGEKDIKVYYVDK